MATCAALRERARDRPALHLCYASGDSQVGSSREVRISPKGEAPEQSTRLIAYGALLLACVATAVSWYQATLSRDTDERSLRAYLALIDFGVFCPDCGDAALSPNGTSSVKSSIRLRIENVGQTPARETIGTINLYSEPGNEGKLPAKFSFPDHKTKFFLSRSDIGRDKHRDGVVELNADDIATIQEAAGGRKTLFLYGHVNYCDIYQHPHTTAYCFKYVPNGGVNLPVCESYNGEILARGRC